MEGYVALIIVIVLGLVGCYIKGKRVELVKFSKELGEGFLALSEFLGLPEDATQEQKIAAAERLRKEWADVYSAGGSLFQKLVKRARILRQNK